MQNSAHDNNDLLLREFSKWILDIGDGAQVVNGSHSNERVCITRMNLIPSDANVSITFQKRQFPLCLCFAMTINKSQGQTLSNVGSIFLDLFLLMGSCMLLYLA